MNGIHDCGGMDGIGPINPPEHEPVFHSDWERRMFGMFISCFAGGHYVVDQFRHGIEKMDPVHYLESTYYEHWLYSIENILVERGVLTREELDARKAQFKAEQEEAA